VRVRLAVVAVPATGDIGYRDQRFGGTGYPSAGTDPTALVTGSR